MINGKSSTLPFLNPTWKTYQNTRIFVSGRISAHTDPRNELAYLALKSLIARSFKSLLFCISFFNKLLFPFHYHFLNIICFSLCFAFEGILLIYCFNLRLTSCLIPPSPGIVSDALLRRLLAMKS